MRKTSKKFKRQSSKFKIGEVFDRLTVLADEGLRTAAGARVLLCQCRCGQQTRVTAALLVSGNTRSCGCLQDELRKGGFNRTHGLAESSEYNSWMAMRARCTKPSHNRWQHYGGRGIKVCDRWQSSFEAFLEDMGKKPSPDYSIDRIDVNGNYEPGNCRWATPMEQAQNKQTHVMNGAHHG